MRLSQHDAKHRRSPRRRPGSPSRARTATFPPLPTCGSVSSTWRFTRGTSFSAARLDETVDPQIIVGLLHVVEPHLDDMLAFGAYGAGPSGTLPPDASLQSRLLDWFGRRP